MQSTTSEIRNKKPTVVAMSGGVDSSVAAALMTKENDNMKEEMMLLQKYTRKIETDLADLSESKDRQEKDIESFKKKY